MLALSIIVYLGTDYAKSMQFIHTESYTVIHGERTVVLERGLVGHSSAHYSFRLNSTTLATLTAVGGTAQFSQHVARAGSLVALVDPNANTCICKGSGGARPFGQGKSAINHIDYSPNCAPVPLSDLLRQRNPSCDVRTYVGGMQCCHHQTMLLDADQEPPQEYDNVVYKWRFYFGEEQPGDQPIVNLVWYISAEQHSIEYDAPAAPSMTALKDTVHQITSNFTGADMLVRSHDVDLKRTAGGMRLIQVSGHCHSPGCLSLELYNADLLNSVSIVGLIV